MSRPNYRVILSFDSERKTFTARVPELPHCTAEGMTRAEAILHVEEELAALYANLAAQGKSPPPSIDEQAQSGEFTVKVSRGLHRELLWQAASEGVELSQLAGELLSSALESRRNLRPRRGQEGNQAHPDHRPPRHDGGGDRRRGGPQGGRFGDMMEDRAHFIEYVRNLENGDNRRGGGGGPRGERHDGGRRGGGGPRGGHGPNRDRRPSGDRPHSSGDQGAPSGNSERGS
ncbi:MAG: hypothetical protein U0787_17870 [Polyangia bacterium]